MSIRGKLPRTAGWQPALPGIVMCSLAPFRVRIACVPPTNLRREKKKSAQIEIAPDPVETAEEAGLRYVSDEQPGYTRKRKGDDFDYFDVEGKPIRDENRLLRIKRI